MIKIFIQIFIAVTLFVMGKWIVGPNLQTELYGAGICTLIIAAIGFMYQGWGERDFLLLYLNTFMQPNSEIRLSIAYLFKIECGGKYLLVKNGRFDNETYQPVGGVYKYFDPETKSQFENMSIIKDNSIENDKQSEHDLRLKMRKRRYLRKFLKWFFSSKDREVDPWREFYEELIATNILPSREFKFIYYNLIGQHFEKIHNDDEYRIDTFKYVDVYTPRLNQSQINELEKLLGMNDDKFIWATEKEIQRNRSNDGKRISDHAYKIFITNKLQFNGDN